MKTIFLLTISLLLTFTGCVEQKDIVSLSNDKINPYEGKDISAYFIGDYMDVKSVNSKLQAAGFKAVAVYSPVKDGTVIIFTDDALMNVCTKSGR